MQKYLLLFILLSIFACSKNLEIPTEKVKETLLKYGKENPENQIIISTKFGKIHLKLYNETPLHRANFIRLVKAGYFDDRKIYRIVKGLCIQGGVDYRDKLNYLIPSEFRNNLIHKRGAISMARYNENNPNKMSSATEFFIVSKSAFYTDEELTKYEPAQKEIYKKIGGEIEFDGAYTTFGEVTKGMEIVDKIVQLELIDVEKPLEMPIFTIKLF